MVSKSIQIMLGLSVLFLFAPRVKGIVGGQGTRLTHENPSLLLISTGEIGNGPKPPIVCGGALFSSREYFITSSLCPVYFFQMSIVYAGVHFAHVTEVSEQQRAVIERLDLVGISNPKIALYKVNEAFEYTRYAREYLYTPDNVTDHRQLQLTEITVAGWGSVNPSNDTAVDTLRTAILPISSDEDCFKYGATGETDPSRVFCGGELAGGLSACGADMGSPIVDSSNGLLGILHRGSCGYPRMLDVFAPLSYYITAITEAIARDQALSTTSIPSISTETNTISKIS